jgi:hypothetical protein
MLEGGRTALMHADALPSAGTESDAEPPLREDV